MAPYTDYHFAHLSGEMPGRGQYEELTYHADFLRFHTRLVERAKQAGKRFRAVHAETFGTAPFPALLDKLDAGEQSIVRELFKSGRRRDEVIWQVINYRMYREIQAIAGGSRTKEGISAWVELFNTFMSCGAGTTDRKRPLHIYFADAQGFARYFLEHLTAKIASGRQGLEPFGVEAAQIVASLEDCRHGTPLDETSFGRFLGWVRLYQSLVEEDTEEE